VTWSRRSESEEATIAAGRDFAAVLEPGDIVLVKGQMGAGKTRFAQGVAHALGVTERVTSPTFTVVRQHQCRGERGIVTLHHVDLYRVNSVDEVFDLALGELVEEGGVAIVEWGDIADEVFGDNVMTVEISGVDDERTITVSGQLCHGREERLGRWAA
jgi:tRNA threonylcarbamoyladenosine biosynthesis protein TsaE